jgi:hypothetical protein
MTQGAPTRRVLGALLLFIVGGAACISASVSGPTLVGVGARVLFIGNSYTYVNDVPGLVQALADSAHDSIAVETVVFPDFALVDHWNEGTSLREVRKGGWRWVVLQQGPSAADVNRDTLRLWTRAFAGEIEKIGGRTALFSAWPQSSRVQDFGRAVESYTLAATDVDGVLLPVAAAWQAAWRRDSTLALYAGDGLHASTDGSYLAALVIYGGLLGTPPVGLPNAVTTRSGATLRLDATRARLLQDAAAEALSAR